MKRNQDTEQIEQEIKRLRKQISLLRNQAKSINAARIKSDRQNRNMAKRDAIRDIYGKGLSLYKSARGYGFWPETIKQELTSWIYERAGEGGVSGFYLSREITQRAVDGMRYVFDDDFAKAANEVARKEENLANQRPRKTLAELIGENLDD